MAGSICNNILTLAAIGDYQTWSLVMMWQLRWERFHSKVYCLGGKLAAAALLPYSGTQERGSRLKRLSRSTFNHFLNQKPKRVHLIGCSLFPLGSKRLLILTNFHCQNLKLPKLQSSLYWSTAYNIQILIFWCSTTNLTAPLLNEKHARILLKSIVVNYSMSLFE